MIVVTEDNFKECFLNILKHKEFSFDCESTGLRVHHGNILFSLAISTVDNTYYFNFKDYGDGSSYLSREWLPTLNILFNNYRTGYAANAKFDMHLLANEGVQFNYSFTVWDVLVIDKLFYNRHMSYSLDSVAERNGFTKLDTVEKYIEEHKLSTMTTIPGKDKRVRIPHYDQVPFNIISEYACGDAEITLKIGLKQREECALREKETTELKQPSFAKVVSLENEVTKVCFDIERRGMKIDEEFIHRACAHESARCLRSVEAYEKISGTKFVDSAKSHEPVFKALGLSSGKTAKGGISFSDETLANCKHPIAEHIREYRDASKRLKSYYQNFLYEADKDGVVHPNIKQTAADTYRFSITSPALQTLNSEEEGEYKVRNSFKARDGYQFLSIDYKYQEIALALDYSAEKKVIESINAGEDPHVTTSKIMGCTRKQAKQIAFGLIYSMGVGKLAGALGVSEDEAKRLKMKFFSSLPNVRDLLKTVMKKADTRGYIFNFYGYRLYFPYIEANGERFNLSYKAPNYLIQSSGSTIMRLALVELHKFLEPYKSKIVMTIHDSIDIELHDSEHFLVDDICKKMCEVYIPKSGLPMRVDFSIAKSWGDV